MGVSRRAVAGGVAWTVPAFFAAQAAPAFAGSVPQCDEVNQAVMSYGAVYLGQNCTSFNSASTGDFSVQIGTSRTSANVGLEYRNSYGDNYWTSACKKIWGDATVQNGVSNLGLADWLVPGSLVLSQLAPAAGDGQTVIFTFSRSVSWLKFSISDIDAYWVDQYGRKYGNYGDPCGFVDNVVVAADGAAVTATKGNYWDDDLTVSGSGSSRVSVSARREAKGLQDATKYGLSVVDYAICGSINSFTVKYLNEIGNTGVSGWAGMDQQIYISPLTIQTEVCACL